FPCQQMGVTMPRGRKKKDETEAPAAGHNSQDQGLTDAKILDFANRIYDGRRAIQDISEERKSKVAEVRAICKAAKATGINNQALTRDIQDRDRSPDAVLAEEKSYLRYANLFRMPVTQIDLFGDVEDPDGETESAEVREAAVQHAGHKGYDAGRQGVDA